MTKREPNARGEWQCARCRQWLPGDTFRRMDGGLRMDSYCPDCRRFLDKYYRRRTPDAVYQQQQRRLQARRHKKAQEGLDERRASARMALERLLASGWSLTRLARELEMGRRTLERIRAGGGCNRWDVSERLFALYIKERDDAER